MNQASRGREDRQKQFKKGIESDEARRRREETTVTLRKSQREDSLQKRRCGVEGEAGAVQTQEGDMMNVQGSAGSTMHDQIMELLRLVMTDDRAQQRDAISRFRKLLSIGALFSSDPSTHTVNFKLSFPPSPMKCCSVHSSPLYTDSLHPGCRAQPSHPRGDQLRSGASIRSIS